MTCCCTPSAPKKHQHRFKQILYIALLLNLAMFWLEIIAGLYSHSSALWADALDFFADSTNYFISLIVLGLSLYWRATAALLKGLSMLILALMVLAKTSYAYLQGIPPEPISMGTTAILALLINLLCALLLYRFREAEANMQSVWLCSRNDCIANLAVFFAAVGVFGSGSILPDVIVALLMVCLGMFAGIQVIALAYRERQLSQHLRISQMNNCGDDSCS